MSLRRNVISNFILTGSTLLFPLVTFPYVTRTLNEETIGRVFFIDAFTQYFLIFSAVGIPLYGVREVVKAGGDAFQTSKLVTELVLIQFSLSLLFSLAFIVLHFTVPSLKNDFALIRISCIYIIANSFSIEWFYQGKELFSYITIRSVIVKALVCVLILLLVRNAGDYIIYYLLTASLFIITAIINFSNYIRKFHSPVRKDNLSFSSHLKPLLILFAMNVSVSMYTVLDTIILGMITDNTNVSFYNVPLKVVRMFWMVVSSLGTVLIPRMSLLVVNEDTEAIGKLMQKSFSIIFLLTIPFCFFCLVFPREILTIISGEKYAVAVNALRLLSIVPIIVGVCNILGTQFLLPIGKEIKILHATIIGFIVSVSLNFLLVPSYKFIGSAISIVSAEAAVCLYILLAAKKNISIKLDYKLLSQISLSVAVSLVIALLAKSYLHNIVLLVASVIFYLITFLMLQLFVFKNTFIFSLLRLRQ